MVLLGIGIDHWKRLARDDWLKKLGEGPNFRLPKFRIITFHNFIMGAKMKETSKRLTVIQYNTEENNVSEANFKVKPKQQKGVK